MSTQPSTVHGEVDHGSAGRGVGNPQALVLVTCGRSDCTRSQVTGKTSRIVRRLQRKEETAAWEKVLTGMWQLRGNHTCVKSGESTTAEFYAPAHMGRNWPPLQKPPFQRHFTFLCEICLPFPSRCPSSSCCQQAGKAISLYSRATRLFLLTVTGPAKSTRGLERWGAGCHPSCSGTGPQPVPSSRPSGRSSSSMSQPLAVPLFGNVSMGLTLNPKKEGVHTAPSGGTQAPSAVIPS